MRILSKSKYMIGLKCPEHLWVAMNNKEAIPEADPASQARMDEGTKVGQLAQQLWPEGISLPEDDLKENIRLTKNYIQGQKPLFEAAFSGKGLYSRADILVPVEGNQWDIYEVKSSTKVKPDHIKDVSFQKHCYEKNGFIIRKCFLVHINNKYVRDGDIDPKQLFIIEEITEEVNKAIEGIEDRISNMRKIISLPEQPNETMNSMCKSPYVCPLLDACGESLPKQNVYELYRGRKKAASLYDDGVELLEEIPDDFKLNDKQLVQVHVAKNGEPYINKVEINTFLGKLKYPLYYLDFETFQAAIPPCDGMRPYQQIPFQFSVHIVSEDGSVKHKEFLAEGKKDPRPAFAQALKDAIGDTGMVVTYNQSFEIGRLRELYEFLPEHENWMKAAITRVIDLADPFKSFAYYHPRQQGHYSIKYVLPALVGELYADLDINNGTAASSAYFDIEFNGGINRDKIRKDLLAYCKLDTEAMVMIVEKLKALVQ